MKEFKNLGSTEYITREESSEATTISEEKIMSEILPVTNSNIEKPEDKKYAVLLVAGQSNAVGYDESPIVPGLSCNVNDRVKQLGLYGNDNLKIIPLGPCAQNFQDMRPYGNSQSSSGYEGTKGLQLPLGNLLVNHIPSDYELLVLPCAYGGTAFGSGSYGVMNPNTLRPDNLTAYRWGVEGVYYKSMVARLKYVLDLNPSNVFLGTIWIQGEHDKDNVNANKIGFEAMTNDFFKQMNEGGYANRVKTGKFSKDQWFNVKTVQSWYVDADSAIGCTQIWDNYKNWNESTYVDFECDVTLDSNATNGTGKTTSDRSAHFGNDAYYRIVSPAIYKKMLDNGNILF